MLELSLDDMETRPFVSDDTDDLPLLLLSTEEMDLRFSLRPLSLPIEVRCIRLTKSLAIKK